MPGPWVIASAGAAADGAAGGAAGGTAVGPAVEYTYVDVPLRCDPASVELTGALPDAMIIGRADPHAAHAFFGMYDLYEMGPVGGRPAYVKRGSRAALALWFVSATGFWYDVLLRASRFPPDLPDFDPISLISTPTPRAIDPISLISTRSP